MKSKALEKSKNKMQMKLSELSDALNHSSVNFDKPCKHTKEEKIDQRDDARRGQVAQVCSVQCAAMRSN